MTDPLEVLRFWFEDCLTNPESLMERRTVWFMAVPEIDKLIAEKFGQLPDMALAGHLDHWASDTRNTLALVLVLDQFPRNIYRNTPRAYDYDNAALDLAIRLIDNGLNRYLHPIEQSFLLLPLEHSEKIENQTRSVKLYKALVKESSGAYLESAKRSLDYAQRHYDIIEQFGRFPHRNTILARKSTKSELEFLETGGETFGVEQPQSP